MATTLPSAAMRPQDKRLSDIDLRMAKVEGNKVSVSWDSLIGQAIDWAISQSNRTQKEVWVEMGHESGAQLNLWISGERRPNFAQLFAIEWLRQPLVIALASLVEGVECETTIRIRRHA